MSKVGAVYSTDSTIQEQSVTFVVDTNILIEFKAINQIDWELLCPRAQAVRIVVPTTVVRQIDRHKTSTGRLRRRALEFNKLLRKIEDGDGETAALEHDRLKLSLTLMPRYAREELPGEKLSFAIDDDLIVAETAKFTQDNADAIFLADDNNARRTAREMCIPVARPAEEWRRSEPRDKRDARIEELERQLGAMPKLSLSLLTGDENEVVFEPIYADEIPNEFCERVAKSIIERNPGVSFEELLKRHNLENAQEAHRGLRLQHRFSVSVRDVEQYCLDYEEFKEGVLEWSRSMPNVLSQLDFVVPIQIEIANNGEAFAEDVEIAVSVSTGFSFVPNRFVRSYLEMKCKAPDPPSRTGEFFRLPTLFEHQRDNRRDPFSFHAEKLADEGAAASHISYECERFRHGTRSVLRSSLVKETNAPSGGQLIVQASSASLAEPIEVRRPIKVNPASRTVNLKEHLWQRLFFFPVGVREAVAEGLKYF